MEGLSATALMDKISEGVADRTGHTHGVILSLSLPLPLSRIDPVGSTLYDEMSSMCGL
jgi:hypothetical protein